MASTQEILIFCLGFFAIIAAGASSGIETGLEPFDEAAAAVCPVAYESGCEIGSGQYVKGTYDGILGAFGGTVGYVTGYTAGLNCALLASGIIDGGKEKKGRCGNYQNQCNLTEAECCKNPGVSCGANSFQVGYNATYLFACKSGYEFGSKQFAQGTFDTLASALGAYVGAPICGNEGFVECSLASLGLASGNTIPGSGEAASSSGRCKSGAQNKDNQSSGLIAEAMNNIL